jgi:hypothetical protein
MSRQPASTDLRTRSIKLVISAAAVATTLGGWGALTVGEAAQARVAGLPATAAAASPPVWLLAPPPIPALPEVAALATGGTGSAPQARAAAPVAAAAPLRTVSAPPAAPVRPVPITITRSSR